MNWPGVVLGVVLLVVVIVCWTCKDWLKGHLNWTLGLGFLIVLTAAGLIVNNNAASPTKALGEWTAWFTNVAALAVAVFGVVDAVPKIGTSVEERAKARNSQRKAEALLASKAAIQAGVPKEVVARFLDNTS